MDGVVPLQPEDEQQKAAGRRYLIYAIGLALLYSVIHSVARVLASPNLGEDDPLTNLYVQKFAWGYELAQPPLYEWLVWLVQHFTGPQLLGFLIVKYALFVGTVGALYGSALLVTRNPAWSLVTAEALTLVYHVGWRFHEGFTGLVPAMFCSALALFFALRIASNGRLLDFVGFGFAIGGGLLSQHSVWITVGSFAGAILFVRSVRRCFADWRIVLAILVGLLVASPHYWWIMSNHGRLDHFLNVYWAFSHPSPAISVERVIRKTLAAPIGFYWSLFLFLLVSAFGRIVAQFRKRLVPDIQWQGRPLLQFLAAYTVAAFLLLFAAGIAVSYVTYAYHDLLAFLLPSLVLMFALIQLSAPAEDELRRWAAVSLAIIAFAFVARAANMFVMEPFCKICRWGTPYHLLAERLRTSGFENGELIALEPDLAGNLRVYFPEAFARFVPPGELAGVVGRPRSGKMKVVVWQVGGKHGVRKDRGMLAMRLHKAGARSDIRELRAPWTHWFRPVGYRHTVWNYVVVRP